MAKINLEKSLNELEQLVVELERGELPLEEALKRFERGVGLLRVSQQMLQEAEQKVEILLNQQVAPFEANNPSPGEAPFLPAQTTDKMEL